MKPLAGSADGHALVRVPKTAEVVAAALRRRIVTGQYAEGAALPGESELMEQFGVSRPSLREALRILESEGLITVRRGAHGGARACRPDVSVAARYLGLLMQMDGVTLSDVYIARAAIEPVAIRLLAASRDRSAAVDELRTLLAAEAAAMGDAKTYAEATTRFHQRLVEMSGNKTLSLLWGTLKEVLAGEVLDTVSTSPPSARTRQARESAVERTLDLIAEGDGDGAGQLWRDQMLRAGQRVLRQHGAKTVVDALG
jgi:DNA-binding FadR family transcriptional regulator